MKYTNVLREAEGERSRIPGTFSRIEIPVELCLPSGKVEAWNEQRRGSPQDTGAFRLCECPSKAAERVQAFMAEKAPSLIRT